MMDSGLAVRTPGLLARRICGMVALAIVCGTAGALDVTTTVDRLNGSLTIGNVSLREAVRYAGDNETINLPPGTYSLTLTGANEDACATGDLDVNKTPGSTMTIVGTDPNAANTIIDGMNGDRIFHCIAGHLTINNITLRNGSTMPSAVREGAGIHNGAGVTLTLTNCVFNNCVGTGAPLSMSINANTNAGSISSAPTTTGFLSTNLVQGNSLVGQTLVITNGTQAGLSRSILTHDNVTGAVTFAALPAAPAIGNTFHYTNAASIAGCAITSAPATTGFTSSRLVVGNSLVGQTVTMTSGSQNGQIRTISAHTVATGAVTFSTTFAVAPLIGDTFTFTNGPSVFGFSSDSLRFAPTLTGQIISFTSGALAGQTRTVSTHTIATGSVTFGAPLLVNPTVGMTFTCSNAPSVSGLISAAPATTGFTATSLITTAPLAGQTVIMTSGAAFGQFRTISTHTPATGAITFTVALTVAPAVSDTFLCTQNFTSTNGGGGIFSFGPVTCTRCTFNNCIAASPTFAGGGGGGIFVSLAGAVNLTDCAFNSCATYANRGGGFNLNSGALTAVRCAFNGCLSRGSVGGGLYLNIATVPAVVTDCVFNGNSGSTGGGMQSFVAANFTRCQFFNNSAGFGAGIACGAGGVNTFTDCESSNNTSITAGGGVHFSASGHIMNNCLIANNTSVQGGGVNLQDCGATFNNCTISANSSRTGAGGGFFHFHSVVGTPVTTLSLKNCTVVLNTAGFGGGVIYTQGFTGGSATAELWKGCIFFANTAPTGQFHMIAPFTATSNGYNLFGETFNLVPFTPNTGDQLGASNLVGVDPLLFTLFDNGGITRSHRLNSTSTGIDRGNSVGLGLTTDQRGAAFPRIVGTANGATPTSDGSDIGSYEFGANGFVVTNTNDAGAGSLRQAIINANAAVNYPSLPDIIEFRIPGLPPAVRTISPVSAYPALTGATLIDGYTQLGSSPNTLAGANNAVLNIEVNGTGAGGGTVGFSTTANSNTIRGMAINRFNGAAISLASSSNVVAGNFIGTNPAGLIALPNGSGVQVAGSTNTIGGLTPATRNIIASNTGLGIGVASGTGNTISGNFVYNNGGLGIDLGNNGLTANDTGDADGGANNLQNSPWLTTIATAGQKTVSGFVDGIAGRNYRIDIFANTAFDATGSGEGEVLLGTVASVASGATFSLTYTPIVGKTLVTATATDLTTGDTSEFSRRNLAPVNTVPARTVNEDVSTPLTGLSISDVDSGGNTIQVVVSAPSGSFSVNTGVAGGVVAGEVAGNGTGTVTLTATLAKINTTFASATGISYLSVSNFNGTVSYSMTTNDQSFAELGGALTTGPTSANITVTAVPDAPNLTSPAVANLNEGATVPVVISGSLNDTDGSETLSFRISGVPSVISFSNGTNAGGGIWNFTPAQLAGLMMSATDNGAFALTISAIATETSNTTTATTSAPFAVNVANVAPSLIGTTLTAAVTENGSVTLGGSFSDPSTVDTYTLVINWGDPANPPGNIQTVPFNASAVAQPFSFNHTYLDDNPSGTPLDTYTVTITVTDDDSGAAAQNFNLPVSNSAPTLTGLAIVDIDENGTTTLSGTINDVGTLDTLTLSIEWGDGDADELLFGGSATGSQTFSIDHQYLDNNGVTPTFTIDLTITDDDTGTSSTSIDVLVANLSPVLTAAANPSTILEGSTLSVTVASFTDVGTLDFHNAEIDWGDGTPLDLAGTITEPNLGNGFIGSIGGSHLFDDGPATYLVTVTVYDNDGGSDTGSFSVTVSNVAPTALFRKGDPDNIDFLGAVEFVDQFDPSVFDMEIPPNGLRYSYDFAYNGTSPVFTYGAGDGTYAGSLITASISIPTQFITHSPNHTILGRIIDKDGGFTDYVLRQPDFMSDENDTLLAEGNLGASFSYTMNADGIPSTIDQPIVYSYEIVDLPEGITSIGDIGLTFDGVRTFSGTFTRQGQITLLLHAVNVAGSDSAYLVITISGVGSDAPQVISKAVAFPNPSLVGAEVEFSVVATDKNGDILSYYWTFGDGTSSRKRVSKHTFTTPGNYVATVSISDGKHENIFQKVNVVVLPADSNTFEITSAKITFDFKTAAKSSLILQGKIPVPADINVDGLDIDVSITDSTYTQTFNMNNKGIGGDGLSQFTLKVAAPGKTQSSSKFTMHLKSTDGNDPLHPSLFQMLTTLGYKNKRAVKEEYPMQLVVTMHTPTVVTNFCTITTVYTCVPNKKGTAVKKK